MDDGLEPVEPALRPGEKLHIPLMHDEWIIRANDLQCQVYIYDGKMPLWKRGQGWAIHVSDFIVEHTRWFMLSETQQQENLALPDGQQLQCTDAHQIIYPSKTMMDSGWMRSWLNKWVIMTTTT